MADEGGKNSEPVVRSLIASVRQALLAAGEKGIEAGLERYEAFWSNSPKPETVAMKA